MLELHLASAEEHVALGADTVERQREIIVKLDHVGTPVRAHAGQIIQNPLTLAVN